MPGKDNETSGQRNYLGDLPKLTEHQVKRSNKEGGAREGLYGHCSLPVHGYAIGPAA